MSNRTEAERIYDRMISEAGATVRQIRLDRKLKLHEVAKMADLASGQSVCNAESGRARLLTIFKIARGLGHNVHIVID